MADECSWTFLQMQPRYSCSVTQLFKWQSFMMTIGKQSHVVFSKFTYIGRCELFCKSLQQKPRHHQEVACFSGKVSCINGRSQPNIHLLYQMTVRHLMCSFRKILEMKTEIHLRKKFDLHEHSLWLPTDRLIAILQSVWGATYEFKAWVTKQLILPHLQCWVHFELIALMFFNILYYFLDWIKDKNGKY